MRVDACERQGLAVGAALLNPLVGLKYAVVRMLCFNLRDAAVCHELFEGLFSQNRFFGCCRLL